MIGTRFSLVLQELGEALHTSLGPDAHNACHVTFPNKLAVWLQPDMQDEKLHIVIELGNPGGGRFRENFFREALRANGLAQPQTGVFCFGAKKDVLLLSECIALAELTGQRLADLLKDLLEKAASWKDAMTRGELPAVQGEQTGTRVANVFGFR